MAIESLEQAIRDPGARESGERDRTRVRDRLRPVVLEFCRLHLFDTFRMQELNDFVRARSVGAPESAGRILRMLRADGIIDCDVVSRSQSLYIIRAVHDNHP